MSKEKEIKMVNVRLIVPMGLPGSGKTHYIETRYGKYYDYNYVNVSFDDYMKRTSSIENVLDSKFFELTRFKSWHLKDAYNDVAICLDGPWFTLNQVENLINVAKPKIESWEYDDSGFVYNRIFKFSVNEIKIVHFKEDREACLNNDRFRRDQSSEITIKNAPFDNEIPDEFISNLKAKFNLESIFIDNQDVYKVSLLEQEFNERKLVSKEWTIAGQWGNCWGDHGELAEEDPKEFKEFEEFVLKLCPDISHSTYTALFNACCEVIEEEEDGYYGSWKQYAYWKCDLKKLYKMMIEQKLVSEYLK